LLFKPKIDAAGFNWDDVKKRLQHMKKIVQTKQMIALASAWREENQE